MAVGVDKILYFLNNVIDKEELDIIIEEEIKEDTVQIEMDDAMKFSCKSCKKTYKTMSGLKRHEDSKHSKKNICRLHFQWPYLLFYYYLDFCRHTQLILIHLCSDASIQTVLRDSVETLKSNLCNPQQIREEISTYKNPVSEKLEAAVNIAYGKLKKKNNADEYYSTFYTTIVKNAPDYLNLKRPHSTLLAQKLCDKLFYNYESKKKKQIQVTPEITEKELDGLQYLAGYVIKKMLKKISSKKDYNSVINQEKIKILENAITDDTSDQRLINCLSRGGLTGVSLDFQRIFTKTEEKFREHTSHEHLVEINVPAIVTGLKECSDIMSYFNAAVEMAQINHISTEEVNSLLDNALQIYLRVRAFSKIDDITAQHRETKRKALRKEIKRSTNKPNIKD